jgi:hypothetical protein
MAEDGTADAAAACEAILHLGRPDVRHTFGAVDRRRACESAGAVPGRQSGRLPVAECHRRLDQGDVRGHGDHLPSRCRQDRRQPGPPLDRATRRLGGLRRRPRCRRCSSGHGICAADRRTVQVGATIIPAVDVASVGEHRVGVGWGAALTRGARSGAGHRRTAVERLRLAHGRGHARGAIPRRLRSGAEGVLRRAPDGQEVGLHGVGRSSPSKAS